MIFTQKSGIGKMDNAYRVMLDKMERFNIWERDYVKSLPLERRLDQCLILFELGLDYQKDIVEKMRRDHLQSLVETKRLSRDAGN